MLLLLACTTAPLAPTPDSPLALPPPRRDDPLDAVLAAQEGYRYSPIGKRDPFRSMTCTTCPTAALRDGYPLADLTLRGVIWDTDRPRAIVERPDGTTRVLLVGSYVGEAWGKVVSIGAGGVEIVEEYQAHDGTLVVVPRSLRLAQ